MAGLKVDEEIEQHRPAGLREPISSLPTNPGYCPVCEDNTVFEERTTWLRDAYVCTRCLTVPKTRALKLLLDEVAPDWRSLDLYESGPGSALADKLAREAGSYTWSHFVQGQPFGTTVGNVRCETLEGLTFPDESFDVVITQDVFEHVLYPNRAFAEIARVLRPGGAHVFTVPIFHGRETRVRAMPGPDGPIPIGEPEYHGDPVNPQGALVTFDWGDDIVDLIAALSGMTTEVRPYRDRSMGLDGEFLDALVSWKRA